MVHKKHLFKIAKLICLIACLLVPATAQIKKVSQNVNVEIREIESLCKQTDAFIKSNKKQMRVFATVDAKDQQWREFKSEKARQNADDGDGSNTSVFAWVKDGKLIYAGFTFQSTSRDWAHYVNYYFRADGSLAKIDAKLNTFYGYLTVERRQYHSKAGKLLKSSVQYFDLNTKQKKKPGDDFIDEPLPIYKQAKSLPFDYLLLRKK
jgi:hypothetical protein